jgi:hypothetical protein
MQEAEQRAAGRSLGKRVCASVAPLHSARYLPRMQTRAVVLATVALAACNSPRSTYTPPPCGVATNSASFPLSVVPTTLELRFGGDFDDLMCRPGVEPACDDLLLERCVADVGTVRVGEVRRIPVELSSTSGQWFGASELAIEGCPDVYVEGVFDEAALAIVVAGVHPGPCEAVVRVRTQADNVAADAGIPFVVRAVIDVPDGGLLPVEACCCDAARTPSTTSFADERYACAQGALFFADACAERCDGPAVPFDLAACPAVDDATPPALAACAVQDDARTPPGPVLGDSGSRHVDIVGPIVEVGTGPAPDECFTHTFLDGADVPTDDVVWARIDDGAGITTVGLAIEGGGPTLQVGDVVAVEYDLFVSTRPPARGSFVLRGEAGALVAYVAAASRLEELSMQAEIGFALGAPMCRVDEQCGSTASFGVVVDADERAEVAPGARAAVGSYAVVNGGLVLEVEPPTDAPATGMCPFTNDAHVLVGVLRP